MWYIREGHCMKKQWEQIDSLWYYFKSDGYLAVNSYIKKKGQYKFWWVDGNGIWNSGSDVDLTMQNVIEE